MTDSTKIPVPHETLSPSVDSNGTRRPYEAPQITDYGDIATLTQTGGLTKKDSGTKNQRIG